MKYLKILIAVLALASCQNDSVNLDDIDLCYSDEVCTDQDTAELNALLADWHDSPQVENMDGVLTVRTQVILQTDPKHPEVASLDIKKLEDNINKYMSPAGIQFEVVNVHKAAYQGKDYTQDIIETTKTKTRQDVNTHYKIWVVGEICSGNTCGNIAAYNYLPTSRKHSGWGMVSSVRFINYLHVSAHEAGHGFGLYHTFQGGCGSPNDDCRTQGDRICDTPPDGTVGSSCSQKTNSCTHDHLQKNSPFDKDQPDDQRNMMDYGGFTCKDRFSPMQISFMRWIATNTNKGFLMEPSGGGDEPDPEPEVENVFTKIYANETHLLWEVENEDKVERYIIQSFEMGSNWRDRGVFVGSTKVKYQAKLDNRDTDRWYRVIAKLKDSDKTFTSKVVKVVKIEEDEEDDDGGEIGLKEQGAMEVIKALVDAWPRENPYSRRDDLLKLYTSEIRAIAKYFGLETKNRKQMILDIKEHVSQVN